MLAFVDQAANVKVFRVVSGADGHVSRERLGVVRKKDFSLDDQLEGLPSEDRASIAEMIAFYTDSAKHETFAALHALPSTLRKVVEYVTTEGSKFEREMVMMSLVEALRVMRKADREVP